MQQEIALAIRVHRVGAVLDGGHHAVLRGHLNFRRIAHETMRDLLDFLSESGREQQRLATLRRQHREDAADRRQKAHVEHAIGLVQHQHLDARQIQVALFDVVDQTTGRGHQHVHAAAQRVGLWPHADAAENDRARHARVSGVFAQVVMHLQGQLARGREDERARRARNRATGRGRQALDQRQRERGGLAGAGLRAGEQVAALQHERNGALLDRCGGGVAERIERTRDRGLEPKRNKRHG